MITFVIIEDDIGPAQPFCPVERALFRTLGLEPSFEVMVIPTRSTVNMVRYNNPPELTTWIQAFDRDESVGPAGPFTLTKIGLA